MYKLLFEKSKQFFIITIDAKTIKYWDKLEGKLWNGALQYLPPSPDTFRKIEQSRNRIPTHFKEMLMVSDKEFQEWKDAKDDNELKEIVIRDCKMHGCNLIDIKVE